jgi:Carboxypeptidase regulatory-like domain/TonB-dependent Receptor Plug Domain
MTCSHRPCAHVRRISFSVLVLLLLAFGFARTSFGQAESASISGTIVDRQGGLVPDAQVSVINTDTDSKFETKTNGSGVYQFPFLKPGHYRIVVTKQGFKQIDLRDLTLNVQDSVNRNFTLDVGATSETVQVNGSAISFNTTDAAVSTVIDRDFVANIPLNGRSFQDLLALVPGVTQVSSNGVGSSGEFTVNGQRTEANSFSVDGVSANAGAPTGAFSSGAGYAGGTAALTALGTTQSIVSVDALQEFRATTSTYSAEYGRTPGGQFSFTTRSGTNDWHGSAFDYFRNEALDANSWFNDTEGVPKEKERQNDFGGTLSGPIRIPHLYNGKDKTFFFFSYEGLRLWTPQGLLTESVPDQTLREQAPSALQPALNAFPIPNKGEDGLNDGLGIYQVGISAPSSIDSISVRVDHNVSDKFKVFGRYASTPSVSGGVGFNPQNSVINNRLVTIGVTNLFTSAQANELRFNITQANSILNNVSTNQGGATPFEVTTLPGPNGSNLPAVASFFGFGLNFGGFAGFNVGQTKNAQRQYSVTDTYSWAIGHHSLKFGVDWRRLSTYVAPYLAYEGAGFASEAAVLANNVGSAGHIEAASESPSPVEPLFRNFSAFVQDEWKVRQRMSLSLGLRWDINPAPSNLTGPSAYTLKQITNLDTAQIAPAGTPLWVTDWHGFAPRLGVAYQLRQAPGRETVLRGGFGVFYDMGNVQGYGGYGGLGFSSYAFFTNVGFPLTSPQMTLPPPSIASPYNSLVAAFDPNLKLPYTLQWNVALEQALGTKQALTVSYVGSAGRRLLETYFLLPTNNPNFALGNGLDITKNGPASDYNALQMQFQRTLSHGLQALASYTFSHSIDNASSNFGLSDLLERASSDFDVRHNFQAALTYDVPGQYSNTIVSGLLSHWALDTRVTARSALPVDVVGERNFINPLTGVTVNFHPNLVPGQPLYLYGSEYPGGKIINYDAFIVPTSGPGFDSEGDTPRNYARDFAAWQANFAIRREFPIHERLHLQFRAEAFNLFNHPAFSGVNANWTSGPYNPQTLFGFGGATGTLNNSLGPGLNALYQTGGPRSLQIALKLIF